VAIAIWVDRCSVAPPPTHPVPTTANQRFTPTDHDQPRPYHIQMGLFSLFSSSGATRDEDVRLIAQSAIAAWSQLAVLPAAGLAAAPAAGAGDELARERAALMRIAPVACQAFHLETLGGAAAAAAGGSWGAAAGAAGGGGSPRGSSGRRSSSGASAASGGSDAVAGSRGYQGQAGGQLLDLSLEDLLAMRARDLKKILAERGIDSQDLFEKDALARRAFEMCCRR